jgi:hypothetical protein
MNQIDLRFITASEKFNLFKYLRYLKLVAAIILFVATGVSEGQLFLYIKIAVFIISIYSIYELIMRNIIFSVSNKIDDITKNTVYIILFSFIAIIFNPIIPIYFADTSIWHTINILSLIIFLVSYGIGDGMVFNDFRNEYITSIIQFELKKSNDLSVNRLSWIAESIEDNITDQLKLRVAQDLYSKVIEIEPNNINAYHKRAIINIKLESVGANRNPGDGLGHAIFDLLKMNELGGHDCYSKVYSVLEMYLNLNSREKRGYSKRRIPDDKKILEEVMVLLFQDMKYWVPAAVRDNISKIENKLNYKDEL